MSTRKPQTAKQELFLGVKVPEGLYDNEKVALKVCCICGSTDAPVIYRQAHFPVVRCRKCSLVYADEHFTLEDLAAFYSGDYYKRAYVCHPPEIDSKIAGDYVDAFRRVDRLVPGGRLLDFGSARGTFLEAMAKTEMGSRWQLEGIDINADEVAMGLEREVPVRVGDIFAGDLEDEAYDAITAFSVLEHMQDPKATLERLHKALRPGGKLLLIVPNGSCLIIKLALLASKLAPEKARSFTDNVFHEEHLYYFSPKTMPQMLDLCGFRQLEKGFQPSYLETHPPGLLIGTAATGLRFTSWVTRRQTMLVSLSEKV